MKRYYIVGINSKCKQLDFLPKLKFDEEKQEIITVRKYFYFYRSALKFLNRHYDLHYHLHPFFHKIDKYNFICLTFLPPYGLDYVYYQIKKEEFHFFRR